MPDSVQKQCEDAVVAVIQTLSLTGLQASEIVARRRPWHVTGSGSVIIHRGITIHPVEETEAPGTNEREDIGYGVGVTMIVPTNMGLTDGRDTVYAWREAIRRKLYHDVLPITLTNGLYLQTKVSHNQLVAPKEADAYEISSLLVRCWMREKRT
jgi:hypothetical protein